MMRNLSTLENYLSIVKKHVPTHRFAGSTKSDWEKWKTELLPVVREALGKMPEKVPLNAEILTEWKGDGLIKQRIIFDVEENLSAVALVFRPEDSEGRLPGILACHGHGEFGKDPVMGNGSSPELQASIDAHNYDYGFQMAQAGYAVIAIDWRGFGQRDEHKKPSFNLQGTNRDMCNIYYLLSTLLGQTTLGLDVHDGKCALDYFCGLDFVDPDRIGVMGLSFGGTMTTWMSLCDERIRATDIICYSDMWAEFGYRDLNFCGSQVAPGMYCKCDVPDLHGLIAPRPLLVEIGAYDDCFLVGSAMKCYREVEKIYAAAGVSEKLELDLFDGPHAWGANRSLDFFKKHLG